MCSASSCAAVLVLVLGFVAERELSLIASVVVVPAHVVAHYQYPRNHERSYLFPKKSAWSQVGRWALEG